MDQIKYINRSKKSKHILLLSVMSPANNLTSHRRRGKSVLLSKSGGIIELGQDLLFEQVYTSPTQLFPYYTSNNAITFSDKAISYNTMNELKT